MPEETADLPATHRTATEEFFGGQNVNNAEIQKSWCKVSEMLHREMMLIKISALLSFRPHAPGSVYFRPLRCSHNLSIHFFPEAGGFERHGL